MTLFLHFSRNRLIALLSLLLLTLPAAITAQENSGAHISPIMISLAVGEEQPLQVLDGSGDELAASDWSVDSSELGEIRRESGRTVLHSKAAGVLHVTALVQGVALTEEVKIISLQPGMLIFGLRWAVPSTGRQLGALQAAPSVDGPDLFTLDQNDHGTYLRAFTNRGQQIWMSRLPNAKGKAELMCGDNIGGAILTVTRTDAYDIYVVDKHGKLSWQHTFAGVRKGYALNAGNLIHLLNQSVDGTSAVLDAWDASSGIRKFELKLPLSREYDANLRAGTGDHVVCAPGVSATRPLRIETSGLFVNTDGDAYAAFTVKHWTIEADKCTAGATIELKDLHRAQEDQLILWRIQPDGSHHATIVETSKRSPWSPAARATTVSPTGNIIPDGFGGILFSVRARSKAAQTAPESSDEFVYRVTEDGELAYKFRLPRYVGPLHDEMVLGEQDLGFAVRGGTLVAFNVKDGSETWRWNSGIPDIKINMATAGGGCAVDTPEGLVLVEAGIKKHVIAPRGSDLYTLGMFINDDPHGLAMVGGGIKPD